MGEKSADRSANRMIPRAEGAEKANGERVQAAQRKALKARERRRQLELDGRRLLERAEAAAYQAAEARKAREWARKERARRAVRLKAAEDASRQAEARHAATMGVARRLAEIAANAAVEQTEARKAEEEALAEVARIEDELRYTEEVRRKPPGEHAAPVVESDPTVVIPRVEEVDSDDTRRLGPLAAGLVLGVLVVVVAVTARSLTTPTAAVRRATEPRAVETRIPDGTVVPDARGLSAFDARQRLVAAELALAGVVPTPGTPGLVVRLTPAGGRRVTPGTPVTLYIGVEPNRYEREAKPSLTPGFSILEERR